MWNKIVNPETGRKVSVYGKTGQRVLKNYLYQVGGTGEDEVDNIQPATASENEFRNWFNDTFWQEVRVGDFAEEQPSNRNDDGANNWIGVLIERLQHEANNDLQGPGAPWGLACQQAADEFTNTFNDSGPTVELLNELVGWLPDKYY